MAKRIASFKKRWLSLTQLPFSLYLYFLISWNPRIKRSAFTAYISVLISYYNSARSLRRSLKSKNTVSTLLIVAGLAGTVYFGVQVVSAETPPAPVEFSVPPPPETEDETRKPKGLEPSKPLGIRVESVGIDAKVIELGKKSDGSMETPSLYSGDTGWYKHGPTPGEIGPAVIAGHVDNLKGPSVFWRLGELKAGDKVNITREDGKTVTFKVNAIKQFAKDEFPTKEVYGNIDHAGLRLITCGGSFDYSKGDYTGNTVVFASIVD
jgi:LPXTG-site transpeptidase (sortase) family protein